MAITNLRDKEASVIEHLTVRILTENEAWKNFLDDGYGEYKPRRIRYNKPNMLPLQSLWASLPATMIQAFIDDTPVGVIGAAPWGNYALGAGIHVRQEYQGNGISFYLIQRLIEHFSEFTLLVNIANPRVLQGYLRSGFDNIESYSLPDELADEVHQRSTFPVVAQLQRKPENRLLASESSGRLMRMVG